MLAHLRAITFTANSVQLKPVTSGLYKPIQNPYGSSARMIPAETRVGGGVLPEMVDNMCFMANVNQTERVMIMNDLFHVSRYVGEESPRLSSM